MHTKPYTVNIPAAAAGAFRVGKTHRLGDTHLYHGEMSIMSDRLQEFQEAEKFLAAAHGDVLCANLGLGVAPSTHVERQGEVRDHCREVSGCDRPCVGSLCEG